MAREAAHQLGTPISSLMGWLKLLENNSINKINIYKSMKRDLSKLENISDKFNKIFNTVNSIIRNINNWYGIYLIYII